MPQYYTPPTMNDTAGLFELATYTNNVADGLMFPIFLLVIFIVTFIASKQYTNGKSLTYASFVCAVLAIPLAIVELINPKYLYIFGILLGAGLVWIKLESGGKAF